MLDTPGLALVTLSYDGTPLNGDRLCHLKPGQKISVGRGVDNDLVLEDPSRLVSRVQAQVSYKNATSAVLMNVSTSTSIFINEREVPPGMDDTVKISDGIFLGRYLLGLTSWGEREVELDAVGVPESEASVSPISPMQFIPEDFDIFAAPDADVRVDESNNFELSDLDFESASARQSLLGDNYSEDLLSGSETVGESEGSLMAGGDQLFDPLALLLGGQADLSVFNQVDLGSELSTPFVAPTPIKTKKEFKPEPARKSEPGNHESRALPLESSAPVVPKHRELDGVAPLNAKKVVPGSDELLKAFAAGAGLDVSRLPEFNVEFASQLGALMLHLTRGTISMMHERSLTKHEMRANVTIIASAGNNPLKFAPDAQSALIQLLGERFSGFMEPIAAIDDAFVDLSAHQVGLVAGARAAVYEVVKKFSPDRLQKYLISNQIIDALVPMSKKSKLWELYEASYSELAGDAKEDFEILFQQAFADAYEKEVDRMNEARGLQ